MGLIHTDYVCQKESMKFDILWQYCIQEEARVANIESLLREYYQALSIHTKGWKKSNFKKGGHKKLKKKFQKKSVKNRRKITQSISATTGIR